MCKAIIKLVFVMLTLLQSVSDAKYNKVCSFPSTSLCGSLRGEEIDGAVIESTKYPPRFYMNNACVFNLKADDSTTYRSRRITLNLTDHKITDCKKKLSIYFYPNTLGTPDVTLSCRGLSPREPVVESTGKYVTFELNEALTSPDYFRIIATTIDPSSTYCSDYKCDNGRCIDEDLVCDNYDHCFDGSDEKNSISGSCIAISQSDYEFHDSTAVSLGMGIIVAIVLGVIGVCVFLCILIICCCRRRTRGTVLRPPASQNTTTTVVTNYQPTPQQPAAYPPAQQPAAYPPAQQPAAYPPAQQPAAYPPAQQAPYPTQPPVAPQPGAYPPPQPAGYPPPGPQYPPAYHDKPYTDAAATYQPPPSYSEVQQAAPPSDVKMPTAPPTSG